MPVLRDITAKLGLDLDKSSFNAADKRVDGVINKLKSTNVAVGAQAAAVSKAAATTTAASAGAIASLTKFFGAAAVGFAGLKLIGLASDVNETLNVLDASFGESSQDVQDWAANFATAAGRSEFSMREMAGTLGAVLNPLMDRNSEAAAEMAKGLGEATVDLASFFNLADSDVLVKLRGGITGEAEGLKQLGIVMNEATLEAFALDQGIRGSVKSMSIAEKTALRYNFILDQASLAQGDAAKTSEGWANATKGLQGALKDLATRLGLSILPFAEKVVIVTRNLVRGFLEWQKGTNFLKAALIVLGVIGAKVALAMLIAWAPVILPMLKFIAVIAIAALILDDFLTFMDGGDSIIGRFINLIFGPGSATAAVNGLKDAWAGMVLFWTNEVVPGMRIIEAVLTQTATAFGAAWGQAFKEFGTGIEVIVKALDRFNQLLIDLNLGLVRKVAKAAEFLGINIPAPVATVRTGRGTAGERNLTGRARIRARRRAARERSRVDEPALASGRTARGVTGVRFATRATIPAPAAGTTVNESNTVTVNVQGSATAKDATRIADAAGEGQRRNSRRTRAALTQRLKPAT